MGSIFTPTINIDAYLPDQQEPNVQPPISDPPPSSGTEPMDSSYFLNNWRNWGEYTNRNPFPSQGQNCTWYAHGRAMQLGYSEYVLDSMWGNAGTWDNSASRGAYVTSQPKAGAIAVWEAYVNGAGSVGHVAFVEKVNSDGTITISESNWAGKAYNVRTISALNPSKFIIVPKG
ncbi:MAG: CHAP domain-containing protein [Leptolyngbyaceae bacterium]|nr:CHAP domain-containing protein [Leptolyngbyaceae bacterium]